jgi:hypothetical protein
MSGNRNIGEHLEAEELRDVLDAPESDARRRHLNGCTRCQVLIEAYQGFLEEPKEPDPAAEALRRSLQAAIDARSDFSAESRADRRVPAGRSLRSVIARLLSQPIPALATLALIGGVAIIYLQLMPESREGRLRQRAPSHARGTAGNVELAPPVHRPDGSIELSWNPVAGADSYEIRIYSGSLDEVARLGPQPATQLRLNRADPSLANVPDMFLIKVLALHESDPIGESKPEPASWP